jgi:hypothetical protein
MYIEFCTGHILRTWLGIYRNSTYMGCSDFLTWILKLSWSSSVSTTLLLSRLASFSALLCLLSSLVLLQDLQAHLTACCVSVKSLNISCEFWSPLSPSFCFQCGLLSLYMVFFDCVSPLLSLWGLLYCACKCVPPVVYLYGYLSFFLVSQVLSLFLLAEFRVFSVFNFLWVGVFCS